MSHGGFYQRRRGILDHLEAGAIDLLDLGLHDYLCLIADYRTGVCSCSSVKVATNCGVNERTIRRRLEKLERLRYIKSWKTQGKRGNYPVMINRFRVREVSGREMSVNTELTTDWRKPYLENTEDVSAMCPQVVRDVSGIQEIRSNKLFPVPPEAVELAEALRAGIVRNNPTAKITEAKLGTWAREADRMMRLDGRGKAEILEVIGWCQRDPFWMTNILSMGTLREKFDQLVLKMRACWNGRATSGNGGQAQESYTQAELHRMIRKGGSAATGAQTQ